MQAETECGCISSDCGEPSREIPTRRAAEVIPGSTRSRSEAARAPSCLEGLANRAGRVSDWRIRTGRAFPRYAGDPERNPGCWGQGQNQAEGRAAGTGSRDRGARGSPAFPVATSGPLVILSRQAGRLSLRESAFRNSGY